MVKADLQYHAWPVVLPWDALSDSGVTTESGLSGLPESDDSEATIAYGGETEEDASTSSITSTCGEDASGPEDVEEESDDDGDELESVYYPVELGG